MKKIIKTLSVVLAMVLLCSSPVPVHAASAKNTAAHKALKKQIKSDKKQYCKLRNEKLTYAFADIDGDKVDELITMPGFGYLTYAVYDYKNGTVKRVSTIGHGSYVYYYPKKKLLYSECAHMGYMWTTYYKYSNGKYKVVAQVMKDYTDRSYEAAKPKSSKYYVNGKKVTKAKYNKFVKSLKKGDKAKKTSSLKWKKY